MEGALRNAAVTSRIEPNAVFDSVVATSIPRSYTGRRSPGGGCVSPWGRPGSAQDLSQAETIFLAAKNERVYRTTHAAKARARKDLIRYIVGFYLSRRRHSALNYRQPIEVNYSYQQPSTAA